MAALSGCGTQVCLSQHPERFLSINMGTPRSSVQSTPQPHRSKVSPQLSSQTSHNTRGSISRCLALSTFKRANTQPMEKSETANLAKSVGFHEVDGSNAMEMEQQLTAEYENFRKRNDHALQENCLAIKGFRVTLEFETLKYFCKKKKVTLLSQRADSSIVLMCAWWQS